MFKSINLSTFTLATDSLLIWVFHFTIEDFLLAIRLLSKENSLLYMLTYVSVVTLHILILLTLK